MTSPGEALPHWARVYPMPLYAATIRQSPRDFRVEEVLGFAPDGDGEHDFLLIEKIGHNTHWLAAQLAAHAGVPMRDVGYAGLKDRDAVTRQWFSVRRDPAREPAWSAFSCGGVTICERARHRRKLKIGAHRANRFCITLRAPDAQAKSAELRERLDWFVSAGLPNYFGDQRFGRDGGNLQLASRLFDGTRLRRKQRGFALSAARALIFNDILDARVRRSTWRTLLSGDRANLDGTGSVFDVDVVDAELAQRSDALDVHPTGTLWGIGAPLTKGEVARCEVEVAGRHADFAEGLVDADVRASSRPLRVRISNVGCETAVDAVVLRFTLPKGAFATALLRELIDYRPRSNT